ncbi:MAG TPA: hypothetical protein VH394_06560, partial [Thermoanaerobaculia bacterium]|nr:hypothetical protein [Thermoanaerobaculia bacterium]
MPACFQRLAGLPALLFLALLLPGCTCGDAKPMTLPNPGVPVPRPFTMPPLVPGPVPAGATVSRSGFDGGPFAAVLPVPPRTSPPSPAEVLDQIEPVLRAAGFHRSLSDLSGPGEPLQLPRPDLKSLSAEVCREPAARQSPSQVALCETLSSGGPPYPKADEAIRNAYGVGYTEWKASLERLSFQYPFSQVVGGVPIDGAGISVFRQENGSLALIHGSLFDRFTVVNKVPGEQSSALVSAALALLARPPEERLGRRRLDLSLPVQAGEPSLVLIPDGTVGQGSETVPALRYAWRVLVGIAGRHESWMVWIDAELGNLLRVASQAKDAATISAVRWRRDPGLCLAGTLSCTELVPFEVDDADNKGMVTLQLANVFEQVENPTGDNLKISSAGFNQPPVNNAATAVCPSGDNSAFRQINVYSHLYSLWKILGGAGMAAIFPEKPVTVYVDYRDDSGGNSAFYDSSPGKTDARSELWFGDGKGFKDPLCPSSPGTRLSGSQDVTIPIHE